MQTKLVHGPSQTGDLKNHIYDPVRCLLGELAMQEVLKYLM